MPAPKDLIKYKEWKEKLRQISLKQFKDGMPKTTKDKISNSLKGKMPKNIKQIAGWNKGTKGLRVAWNKGLKGFMAGEKNWRWKGGVNAEYDIPHRWLKIEFGKAYLCENRENNILNFKCKNLNNKFCWAKKKECGYEKKRENFMMLCYSCHNKYDQKQDTVNKRIKTCKETWDKKDRKIVKRIDVLCSFCKKKFEVYERTYNLSKLKRFFCCRECYIKWAKTPENINSGQFKKKLK